MEKCVDKWNFYIIGASRYYFHYSKLAFEVVKITRSDGLRIVFLFSGLFFMACLCFNDTSLIPYLYLIYTSSIHSAYTINTLVIHSWYTKGIYDSNLAWVCCFYTCLYIRFLNGYFGNYGYFMSFLEIYSHYGLFLATWVGNGRIDKGWAACSITLRHY